MLRFGRNGVFGASGINPSPGWFKLSIDGSAIGDKITGGGVVRDHHGNFIGGFSVYYGHGTNNLAQFLALRDGLFMCFALNIAQVRVESNSMVAVLAMSSGRLDNWRLEFCFSGILKAYAVYGRDSSRISTEKPSRGPFGGGCALS